MYIEANSGAVKRVGRSDAYATVSGDGEWVGSGERGMRELRSCWRCSVEREPGRRVAGGGGVTHAFVVLGGFVVVRRLSVCLSACLSVWLFAWLSPFRSVNILIYLPLRVPSTPTLAPSLPGHISLTKRQQHRQRRQTSTSTTRFSRIPGVRPGGRRVRTSAEGGGPQEERGNETRHAFIPSILTPQELSLFCYGENIRSSYLLR